MLIKNILFDLDGTLVDSAAGIEFAVKKAITEILTANATNDSDLRSFIGPPIRDMLINVLHLTDKEILAKLIEVFRREYDESGWQKTGLYAGVHETLSRLKKLRINSFIVTNKPKLPTVNILNRLDLRHFFKGVVTPDAKVPAFKSKVESMAYLLDKHALNIDESIYVGDSDEDRRAVENSGIRFLYAAYGYGTGLQPEGSAKESALDKISDLLAIIKKEDL